MPTSRARVASPKAGQYATALVAELASRVPASLEGRTTLLVLDGAQAHVTPADGVLQLEVTADDEDALARTQDALGHRLLRLAERGELAVEWWLPSGELRRTELPEHRQTAGHTTAWLMERKVELYRRGLGWLLDHRCLLLTHAGRRTGLPQWTVLKVVEYDPSTRRAVVMSPLGRRGDWYLDLQQTRPLRATIGRDRFTPLHRELPHDEAVAVLADYERRHRWTTPLRRLAWGRLAGWRYYGTDACRRRLARQLPLLELRPEPGTTQPPPRDHAEVAQSPALPPGRSALT